MGAWREEAAVSLKRKQGSQLGVATSEMQSELEVCGNSSWSIMYSLKTLRFCFCLVSFFVIFFVFCCFFVFHFFMNT